MVVPANEADAVPCILLVVSFAVAPESVRLRLAVPCAFTRVPEGSSSIQHAIIDAHQSWGLSVVVVVDAVVVVVVVAAARRKTKFWPCADQTRTPRIRSTKITTKSHLTTCRPSPSGSH